MKKAIVILLALAVLGGVVFAQDAAAPATTFAGGVWGEVGLYNNGTVSAIDSNTGYNLDVDYDGEVFGYSAEFEFATPNTALITDPATPQGTVYMNYAYGFAKMFGGKAKFDFGQLWITSYRLRNAQLGYVGGAAIGNQGAALEVFPIDGLAIALNLPMLAEKQFNAAGTTPYTQEPIKMAHNIDVLAKYTMADVGTFYAGFMGEVGNNTINVAVNLNKLIPDVTIMAGYYMRGIGAAVGTDPTHQALVVGEYKLMDSALALREEAKIDTATPIASLGWHSYTLATYRMGDIRGAFAFTLSNGRLLAADYIKYRVKPAVRFYKGDNYVDVAFQYDGSTLSGAKATWKIPVAYSVWF